MSERPIVERPPCTTAVVADQPISEGHLCSLPGSGSWALWRWAAVRAPGFPAANVLQLANTASTSAADQLLDRRRQIHDAQVNLAGIVDNAVDAWTTEQAPRTSAAFRDLLKLRRYLANGNLLGAATLRTQTPLSVSVRQGQSKLLHSIQKADKAAVQYREIFSNTVLETSQAMRSIAADPRFQEAMIWQNRAAYRNNVQPFLQSRNDAKENKRHRDLIYRYCARYCVKNDSIGFFGPVGWAMLAGSDVAFAARPGPDLVKKRTVYFEAWCIDALVERLCSDGALRPWLRPRIMPTLRVQDGRLWRPLAEPIVLDQHDTALLEACDGRRGAAQIAKALCEDRRSGFIDADEVFAALDRLVELQFISWTLELPHSSQAGADLRNFIDGISDTEIRSAARNKIGTFEAARVAIAAATCPVQLNAALNQFDDLFADLTGRPATRLHGQPYIGRTLVYQDCQRDLDTQIGTGLLVELGKPLSLLLDAARWFTWTIAQAYRRSFLELFDARASAARPWIDLPEFMLHVGPLLKDASIAESAARELVLRWSNILAFPSGERRLSYSSDALRRQIDEQFAAPAPGWLTAKYHSPDILIAAESSDAIARGDYVFVLGELHAAANTLRSALFTSQHPAPHEIFGAFDADLGKGRLAPVPGKDPPPYATRFFSLLGSKNDFYLVTAPGTEGKALARSFDAAALVVRKTERGLVIVPRNDNERQFDLVDTFSAFFGQSAIDRFSVVPPQPHTPRISFDKMVVTRETWRLPAGDVAFATAKTEEDRFVQARQLMHATSMPRFVFVKLPNERQPCFIDFCCATSINIVGRRIAALERSGNSAALVSFNEMLPDFSQLWLPDSSDARYTSELRLVAVDQRG